MMPLEARKKVNDVQKNQHYDVRTGRRHSERFKAWCTLHPRVLFNQLLLHKVTAAGGSVSQHFHSLGFVERGGRKNHLFCGQAVEEQHGAQLARPGKAAPLHMASPEQLAITSFSYTKSILIVKTVFTFSQNN